MNQSSQQQPAAQELPLIRPEDEAFLREHLAACCDLYRLKGLAPEAARKSGVRLSTIYWQEIARGLAAQRHWRVVLADLRLRLPQLVEACAENKERAETAQ